MSHRRYNPLTNEWVLCSPGRLKRPWQGQREPVAVEEIAIYDEGCYMCPGNLRSSGRRNPDYEGVFVFDNDFPALDDTPLTPPGSALLVSEPAKGSCRVVCFSERHDAHLAEIPEDAIRSLVDTWARESDEMCVGGAHYVQIFENRGDMMGASNPHPHGQMWGVEHVPTLPSVKARQQQAYWSRHGRDLLGDYVEEELRHRERLVDENDHWTQVVPFWAVWPYETMLIPKRHVGTLGELDGAERSSLAELLRRLTQRYDRLFETPFPYSMGWYQRPFDGSDHFGSRLHASYLPPLLRSASVRKFLVGYELSSEPQRDFTAEQAAARLRR